MNGRIILKWTLKKYGGLDSADSEYSPVTFV